MPSLMRKINIISRCSALYRAEKLADSDIGDTHHAYILTICRNPGISQEALAKKLFFNKSTVTRTLAYLEKHGYVTRRHSTEDRRVILVSPTDKAYDSLPMIRDVLYSWNEYLMEDLSAEEIEMLGAMLSRLASKAAEYAEISNEAMGEIDSLHTSRKDEQGR